MIINVNGKNHEIPVEFEKSTLLTVLREYLHLMGTKKACGTNDCGACKVLVDMEAVNSCCIPVKKVEGKLVITIEGVGDKDKLHPIQKAFVEAGAIQCGFCTPAMVLTTMALLHKNHTPSDEEIREALGTNMCRCTGFTKIVEAIKLASAIMYGMEYQNG